MKYMGSKNRIAKDILPIILSGRGKNQWYVKPFVGGANIIDKVDGNRIGNDINQALIECFKALQKNWTPPCNITKEKYDNYRDYYNNSSCPKNELHLMGYIGINGSYGGRWFDGGYAGETKTKNGKIRNYPLEAYKNVMTQKDNLTGIIFKSVNYKDLLLPQKSIIYCDPPYVQTKEYAYAKKKGFDTNVFWEWCRKISNAGHTVFISEYVAPMDFKCVWEKEISSSLSSNGMIGGNKKSVEKLFTLR